MRTTQNLGYNYGAPLWTIFGDELSECQCDVSTFDLQRSMCRPLKIDVLTFEDRRSMCRPSRIDDRCVDLRRWMIDVPTFEDWWPLCRSRRRWSMWNYVATLAQNIDGIVVCELRRGFALQCFHCSCPVCMYVCVCPLISAASHIGITQQRYNGFTAIQRSFKILPIFLKMFYSKVMA